MGVAVLRAGNRGRRAREEREMDGRKCCNSSHESTIDRETHRERRGKTEDGKRKEKQKQSGEETGRNATSETQSDSFQSEVIKPGGEAYDDHATTHAVSSSFSRLWLPFATYLDGNRIERETERETENKSEKARARKQREDRDRYDKKGEDQLLEDAFAPAGSAFFLLASVLCLHVVKAKGGRGAR